MALAGLLVGLLGVGVDGAAGLGRATAGVERLMRSATEAWELGRYDDAYQSWARAAELARAAGDESAEARAQGSLGLAYHERREDRAAIEPLEALLTLTRRLGERAAQGVALNYLGTSHLYLRQYERALSRLEPALTIVRETGDRLGESVIAGAMAIAHQELGRYGLALEAYRRLEELGDSLDDESLQATAVAGLGTVFDALGNDREARRHFERSRDLLATTPRIGEDAGKLEVVRRMRSARIVHLATHGHPDSFPDDPVLRASRRRGRQGRGLARCDAGDPRPVSRPVFWAAFTLIGSGG